MQTPVPSTVRGKHWSCIEVVERRSVFLYYDCMCSSFSHTMIVVYFAIYARIVNIRSGTGSGYLREKWLDCMMTVSNAWWRAQRDIAHVTTIFVEVCCIKVRRRG